MTTAQGTGFPEPTSEGFADQFAAQRSSLHRWQRMKVAKHVALSITATTVMPLFLAPISTADPSTHLRSEIDVARSDAGCPPFQSDPFLNDVSHNIAEQTDEYVRHAARFFPPAADTGDAALMRVLRESGSKIVKARLVAGYGDPNTGGPGDNESKGIKGAVVEGLAYGVFSDCGYTKYGFSAINDDSSQGWPSTAPRTYTVTTVIVAAD
jgi:hypothetical protein